MESAKEKVPFPRDAPAKLVVNLFKARRKPRIQPAASTSELAGTWRIRMNLLTFLPVFYLFEASFSPLR